MQSEVGGAAFLQWAHISSSYNVYMCEYCLKLCLYSLRASPQGSKFKVSKGETLMHSTLAGMH